MSESYKATGIVKLVGDTQTVGAKGFQKREIVLTLEADSKYPQDVPFVLTRDNCDSCDTLMVGQELTVHFNLRGNYWAKGDRYFGSNEVWKIEGGATQPATEPSQPAATATTPADIAEDEQTDDFPF